MSDVATSSAVQARLQVWWQQVDPATRAIFEEIYRAAPDAVVQAISGGELAALPDGTADLGQFLENENGEIRVPAPAPTTEITVTPERPDPNTAFTLSWTEYNGGAAAPAYKSRVVLTSRADGSVVYDQEFDNDALDAGASVQRQHQVVGGVPEASYDISLWINSEGGDGSGVPPAAGLMSGTSGYLAIGLSDDTRPNSPFEADVQGIVTAVQAINDARNVAQGGTYGWDDMKGYIVQGMRGLAAVTNDENQQATLVTGAQAVENDQTEREQVTEQQMTAINGLLTDAGAALYPLQGGQMTREYIEQYLPDAVVALDAVARAIAH